MPTIAFNGRWTASYIREIVVPELESFRDVVTERIFPALDNFMKEARGHVEKWFREQIANIDPDNPDREDGIAYFADEAMNKTMDYADTLVGMYFASTALYTLGLFHLFEQHAAELPLRVYSNHSNESSSATSQLLALREERNPREFPDMPPSLRSAERVRILPGEPSSSSAQPWDPLDARAIWFIVINHTL